MVSTLLAGLAPKICSRVLPSKRSVPLSSQTLHPKITFLNNLYFKREVGASVLILSVKQTVTTKKCTTFFRALRAELWQRDPGMISSRSTRVRAIFRSVLHPVKHLLHKSCSTITQSQLCWVEVDQWKSLELPNPAVTALTTLATLSIQIRATKLRSMRAMRASFQLKHLADRKVKSKLQGINKCKSENYWKLRWKTIIRTENRL